MLVLSPTAINRVLVMKRSLIVLIMLLLYVQFSYSDRRRISSPEECNRVCVDGEQPKICYYRFVIEFYTTVNKACDRNDTFVQCVLADGVEKTMVSINRKLPGDPIRVCQYDTIVVDVVNEAEGTDMAIHWHGIFQKGFQYYDGVPYLTQCPIRSGNTFRYKFGANNAGTHFYHSHESLFEIDGVHGSLIVRKPRNREPNARLYDQDLNQHEMIISDWFHELSFERFPGRYRMNTGQVADNFLINGKGTWTDPKTGNTTNVPLAVFTVQKGKRYRFRVINAFGTVCGSQLSIAGHSLTIMAHDGEDIEPISVNVIETRSGERVDFVLTANQEIGVYLIQLLGLGECAGKGVKQFAILKYLGASGAPKTPNPVGVKQPGPVYNSLEPMQCENGKTNGDYCISILHGVTDVPNQVLKVYPDRRYFLTVGYYHYSERIKTLFHEGSDKRFFVAVDKDHITSLVSNVSYLDPSAPLASQWEGYQTVCNENAQLGNCSGPCFCSNIYDVPTNSVAEMVLVDTECSPLEHPFHLHGYAFYVLSMGRFDGGVTRDKLTNVLRQHHSKLVNGEYKRPTAKDTIAIPCGGWVIIRFFTDNPGWWFFHCHFLWHTATGMNVVVRVGSDSELPPVPPHFPTCYDWTPPINDYY